MNEFDRAVLIANKVLDKADQFGAVDPDGDLAVLARQFLRARERLANAIKAGEGLVNLANKE